MKKLRITIEEKQFLAKLSFSQLQFFKRIALDKDFPKIVEFANFLIDYEKNVFFRESSVNQSELVAKHQYARGGIAMLTKFLHVVVASEHELNIRSEEKKKIIKKENES